MKLQDIPSALSAIADEGRFRRVEDLRMVTASRGIRRDGKEYIVFNSNDYLGMTHESEVMAAARRAVIYGTGSGGARLTSGAVFELSELEKALAAFKHAEDAVIFNTGYMTNLGVLYALAGKGDVIFSDALNHASIVDGCRISKARVVIYAHSDMEDLARLLAETPCEGQRFIVTDGVFSMDGIIADLKGICDLADEFHALVMVDDSHAAGFVGKTGRGTAEYCGVQGRVDIITGTLGKALGGASGGFTSARKEIVDLLRQRSRPYLFSNTLAPAIAGASMAVFDILEKDTTLRDHLEETTAYYRQQLTEAGFDIIPGVHPIVPVMLYDERLAGEYAKRMMEKGVYVVAFSYPVVPKGKARIRTQVCATHTKEDIDYIVKCFKEVRDELK